MLPLSVRKIHNHNSHKVIGFSYSHKMNSQIQWESTLERDWLLHLEANPLIKTIKSQPQKFDYCLNGNWHRYTPDFEVHWKDSNSRLPTIYEVKPDEITESSAFKEEANSVRIRLATLGYEYVVVDSKTILGGNHLNNLNMLKHYVDVFVNQRDRQVFSENILQHGSCSLAWLSMQFGDKHRNLCSLYKLLWEGWLDYDKRDKVNTLLSVHLSKGEQT